MGGNIITIVESSKGQPSIRKINALGVSMLIHAPPSEKRLTSEGFNDCGERGYDDFVPGKVTKTAPSGDRTT